MEEFPNLIVARSFSKFYGLAGVRAAYALCGKEAKRLMNYSEKYLGFDILAQKLAIAALASGEHYLKNAEEVRKQKARFSRSITEQGYQVYATDTISVIVKCPESYAQLLKERALEKKILIRNLAGYYPKLTNFYRVTVGPEAETTELINLFTSVSKEKHS